MLYGSTHQITIDGQVLNGFQVSIPNPPKTAVVRLPNASESAKYYAKYIDRLTAQRKKNAPDFDRTLELELFNSIRVDKGEPFDEYEAEFIISKITGCLITASDKTADGYKVTIKTPFGEVSHTMKQPTFKQVAEFRKASTPNPNGYSLNPSTTLFDSLVIKSDGYVPTFTVSDIPPDHKSLCINEVILAHDLLDPLTIDPNG